MTRAKKIANAIARAILRREPDKKLPSWYRLYLFLITFFTIYNTKLYRYRGDLFKKLREERWRLREEEYVASFEAKNPLKLTGDMGYSGSSFFITKDERFMVKSVPRGFEHTFFRDDFLLPYFHHMDQHPESLLIRITDFLAWKQLTVGIVLGITPRYHIVMENLLAGREEVQTSSDKRWETFDLKPTSYFYPERDVAGGMLASEATKSRLADEFNDKILLTQKQKDDFMRQIELDTKLLEESNAVDYSLYLARIPLNLPENPFDDDADADSVTSNYAMSARRTKTPSIPPSPPVWRSGITSQDGKYIYRAAILDFFWAKHKVQPRLMTFLINAYNLVDRQGPMSITTQPDEYRTRFLDMCREIVEVQEVQ